MEQKLKIVIIGLIGLLLVSLFLIFQTYNAKQMLENERVVLKRENVSLETKAQEGLQENRRLQEMMSALNSDLDKVAKEREEIQGRFELVSRERTELAERLKQAEAKIVKQAAAPALAEQAQQPLVVADAYWAKILKDKNDLGLQLEKVREELKNASLNNENLQRDKSAVELELKNLDRDNQDLKRQLEYNQKLMDSLARDLVNEKNDKMQIQENLKPIKSENEVLRRQLRALNSRKSSLETKVEGLQKDKDQLARRLDEMDRLLKVKMAQIDNLKARVEQGPEAQKTELGNKSPVELPPIVVRPQTETAEEELKVAVTAAEGKILAVNKDNNFVIIDLGQEAGVKTGDIFEVYRQNEVIGRIEVIQLRPNISACDIKKQSTPIRVSDIVR